MSHTYLTIEERSKIEVLVQEGYKINHIANLLGRHRSTIYRELNRCSTPSYVAKASQADANQLAAHKGRKAKHTPKLLEDIQHKLEMTWSPEQIVGRDYQEKLSFKTIYNWIYEGILNVPLQVLRHKGKGRQPQETRGKFNIGRSISQRPKSVRNRQEFGHWELDTMVSSRGKSKGCLATFAERKSRLYLAFLIPNRTKDAMHNAIEQLTSNLPEHALKSFTSDRGKEFACYPAVEASGIDFYFADAYSAWQRGTNENSNGLMREFFPKKTDLAKVSETELFTALWLMNNRPRKCLNYQTPLEKFMHETSLIE